jgi:hypothetical protein
MCQYMEWPDLLAKEVCIHICMHTYSAYLYAYKHGSHERVRFKAFIENVYICINTYKHACRCMCQYMMYK